MALAPISKQIGPRLPSGSFSKKTDYDKKVLSAYNYSKPSVAGSSTARNPYSSALQVLDDRYAGLSKRDAERQKKAEEERKDIFEEDRKKQERAEREAAERRSALTRQYMGAQQALIERMKSLESPEVALDRFSEEEGLNEAVGVTKGLREQIDRINKTLKRLDEDVTARSMQSGLTEAQRQRLVTSEANPLREQLSEVSAGLGSAVANVQDIRGTISQKLAAFAMGQEQSLEPLRQAVSAAGSMVDFELPFIADKLARDVSRYTAERQSRLDQLLDSFQRGQDLDDAQLVEASQLAREEAGYVEKVDLYGQVLNEAKNGQGTTGSSVAGDESSADLGVGGTVNVLRPEDYEGAVLDLFGNLGIN